jgi:sulfite dehydrogenase (quinone) subunit SoeC
MHPAPSIIVFTTLSGAGFGLIAWLGLGVGPEDTGFGLIGCGLALVLAGIGLLASLWHLGNPQRAWRALSQWRSSWLSREGVLALATLAAFGLYALIWIAGYGRVLPLGILSAMLAAATVYATAMIYGSIKAVPRWSRAPTPLLFLAYAGAGGGLAFLVAALPFGAVAKLHQTAGALLLLIAGAAALIWTVRAGRIGLDAGGSSPETAIGLPKLGRARLFEAPHTAPNYLLREMVFRVGRKHAQKLRVLAFNGAFIFPLLSMALGALAPSLASLLILALPVHLLGVAASRWLFFAEAEHVVSLYYGYR